MSFLDRIIESNQARFDAFLPLLVRRWQVGWIHRDIVPMVLESSPRFAYDADAIWLCAAPEDRGARTEAMEAAVGLLARRGIVTQRGERLAVASRLGAAPLFELDCGATQHFGVRTYGVHVNGYVHHRGQLFVWLRRPARNGFEQTRPWSTVVGSVVPPRRSLEQVLCEEAATQAGIPCGLAAQGQLAGAISWVRECPDGLAPNTTFVFDLELASFEPAPLQGRAEDFSLCPVEELRWLVSEPHHVDPSSAVVIIDFLLRHGAISPCEPDYSELVYRLRSGLRPRSWHQTPPFAVGFDSREVAALRT
ncbi:DUF4743 domain-containing protein [Pendulispora rubella]|uniref:DUF4743 domain-containing protein n=1 Tax=Pendulispora rubella TaxID=2741070 RepID=A0ABZ2L8T6_9BACT